MAHDGILANIPGQKHQQQHQQQQQQLCGGGSFLKLSSLPGNRPPPHLLTTRAQSSAFKLNNVAAAAVTRFPLARFLAAKALLYLQGGPKKSVLSKKMARTPLKSIRKGKSWCVSENSALMLQDRHQTFQN